MKITERTGSDERKLLIAMIVDKRFLSHAVDIWDRDGLFKSKWSNLIGKWCIRHYKKYKEAPGNKVEHLFEKWEENTRDSDSARLIEKFLSSLSDQYEGHEEEINTQYTLDVAQRHFNKIKLARLVEKVENGLDVGDVDEALSAVLKHNTVEVGLGAGIDVLIDKRAIQRSIEWSQEQCITYPGRLGPFMGRSMVKGGFVSFLGPEKRGKSFWLLDTAFRAVCQRKKVAYFEAGDNSEEEVVQRLLSRVARRPVKKGVLPYPTSIERVEDEYFAEVGHEKKKYKDDLSWQKAWKACQELTKRKIKSKHSFFKLSCHPNSTLSINGIESILQSWERDDWVPDVIVIDYADILNMDGYGVEGRDRINETWKAMRGLSQTWHSLVLTATQAKADSYKKEQTEKVMSKDDFSDDKRKLAHVTAMIGLNQNKEEEKDHGIMRLNYVVLRHGKYSEKHCVHVAGCLGIANPAVRSCT